VFACGKPTYLLDVNTRKIVNRFFYYPEEGEDKAIAVILKLVTPEDPEECKVFYWGLIDFSALICTKKPKCGKCPIRERCSYYLHTARS
jgi:adenine-specific DNA glycosylase